MSESGGTPQQQTGAGQAAPAAAETEKQRAERLAIIEAFAGIITQQRKEAIEGRRRSGIEDIWREDEEHYDGIDDANRGTTRMVKGRNMSDGPREQVANSEATRSTVFLKMTRPYVDAASARVGDMLLPTDDRNFAVEHSPVPDLVAKQQDMRPVGADGQPLPAGTSPAAVPPQPPQRFGQRIASIFGMGQPAPAPAAPQRTVADMANEIIDKAKVSAERAQTQIDDWLTDCRYHAEVRLVIEGASKVGTGILKGPIPAVVRRRAAIQGPRGWTVQMVDKTKPQSKFISHWNFFPDPNCGTNIQKGAYTWECDDITARGLRELKRDPKYIAEMIDLCLEVGPCNPVDGTRKLPEGQKVDDGDLFQIWYYYGQVSRKDMEAAGCKCETGREMYPAMVTMVDSQVVRISLSQLDSGEFPYDIMVWQARTDHWAGVGVARQMRECQKGANAAVRNLMDNAGLSAGPQIIVDRRKIVPANGRWEITPRKLWWANTEDDGEPLEDARKAFMIINIETRQQELMEILMFWLREAEEVTGLPMLLQGHMGEAGKTDKVGIVNVLNNNGSTVLRRIARNFDDRLTEPHIGRYYEFLLIYGPDDAKGDFTIDARGSSALVQRELQSQQLVQILGLSLRPEYALDPELVMREFLKSLRFDPKNLELSDERKKEIASRPAPEDPRITAAKIMADSRQRTNSDDLVAQAQIARMQQQHDATQSAAERSLKQMLANIDARMQQVAIDSDEQQHLAEMKVQLAKVTLQLKTQENLSIGGHVVDMEKHRHPSPQVATPGAEPPQRAPAGDAFVQ